MIKGFGVYKAGTTIVGKLNNSVGPVLETKLDKAIPSLKQNKFPSPNTWLHCEHFFIKFVCALLAEF